MLPELDEFGNLPPGIHRCSITELAARFGQGSNEREVEMSELLKFIDAARARGVRRLLVNGSFVTSKLAPNDVDVVFLPGAAYPQGERRLDDNELIWPFLPVFVAADDQDFETWATRIFETDKRNRIKGVVEVVL